jgi:hypothetical protein
MPAVSQKQARYFRYVEHNPAAAKKSGMSHQQLHDYAATPDAGLPEQADNGYLPAGGNLRWIGHDADGSGATGIYPSAHRGEEHGMTHRFAKTTGTPTHMEDGQSGVKHWIQGAVKRPGALTKKANAAGQSPMSFAHSHEHSPGLTGQQARFAVNAQKRR